MSNANYTHITIILDRSGSMADIASDVIGGFNQFLADQRNVEIGHATLSLVQFDTAEPFQVVHDFRMISMVPELNAHTYQPRGGTPLLDAVGEGILALDRSLSSMRPHERPGRTLFVIITDGEENSSHQFTHRRIRSLIEDRTSQGWQFIYLSADLAAFADSDRIAIAESSRMAFDKNSAGTHHAFMDLSRNICESRIGLKTMEDNFFEESDRAKHQLEQERRGQGDA